MLVVSDSSPLNFLIRLQAVEILPRLFETVLIPHKVREELSRPSTPVEVRDFIASNPAWLQVRSPVAIEDIPKLHAGELAAISLAIEARADLVLLDDGDARRAASLRGLQVTGLLGILERADIRGYINLSEMAHQLPVDYHIDHSLVEAALERRRRRMEGAKGRPE